MTDQAAFIHIEPVQPWCWKCRGPLGDSIGTEPHPFHDDGSVNEDDIHLWERGGEFAALRYAQGDL